MFWQITVMSAFTELITGAHQRVHARLFDRDLKAITQAIQKLKIFDSYAQASCRYVCQRIFQSLPPELCDMIIECVVGHDGASVEADITFEPVYTLLDNRPTKHYWNVEYVGKTMLARMMAVWYRISSFMMLSNHGYLRGFLYEEVPCLNLPRYKLVTKISIIVEPDSLPAVRANLQIGARPTHGPAKWEQLIQDFETLHHLRSGASIHVLIDYPKRVNLKDYNEQDTHRKRLLFEGTTPMLASLSRLRDAGYIIGASLRVGGRGHGADLTFQYLLVKNSSLDGGHEYLPANDTGWVWR
jgi:hypothetical protein